MQRTARPGEGCLLPVHAMTAQSAGSARLRPKSDTRHDAQNFHHNKILSKILINVRFSFLSDVRIEPLAKNSRKKVYVYIYICVCVCVCVCVLALGSCDRAS